MRAPTGYLALGDSYTIGEGVAPADRWPARLVAALAARGIALATPEYIATSGWTTDELSAAIAAVEADGELQPPYARVSLGIGVNDQYRGRGVDEYLAGFEPLLARALAFAGDDAARVFVPSIPDWGVTPFAADSGRDCAQVGREIDAFNAAAAAACARAGVRFVDITGLSRSPALRHALVGDGLHPDAVQYAAWAARIADALAPDA